MKIDVSGTAHAEMPIRRAKRTGLEPTGAAMVTLTADIPDQMPDDVVARIYILLNREAERLAQVAAVSIRDQEVNRNEAERIRQLPKERPHIIVAVGTKEPDAVMVVRGSFEVGGKKMTAKKGEGR